ncbi:hypothetical protein CDAR_498271 [Caerostris darwini]|uniref:Uncharacterized protein n=1 Tax=Caerostris darwini TaxID=1538125 RepID=A0AAV4U022_9ARAC|nr:hypothetical protein CDAR_498271 [Caerostris darwini]
MRYVSGFGGLNFTRRSLCFLRRENFRFWHVHIVSVGARKIAKQQGLHWRKVHVFSLGMPGLEKIIKLRDGIFSYFFTRVSKNVAGYFEDPLF